MREKMTVCNRSPQGRSYCLEERHGLYIQKYLYHSGYEMTEWKVEFHDRFKGEITDLPADVRVELLAHLVLLREKGFRLGRPEVDTRT
jgi:hypothetical protein